MASKKLNELFSGAIRIDDKEYASSYDDSHMCDGHPMDERIKWSAKFNNSDEYYAAHDEHFTKLRNELECLSIWDSPTHSTIPKGNEHYVFANLDDYVMPRFKFTLIYNYYGKDGKQTETTSVVDGKLGSVWLACETLLLRSVMNGGSETMFIEGFRRIDTGNDNEYVAEIIRGS